MSKVLFVEYRRCSTCRKAAKWLESKGVDFEERSIVDDVPTVEELKAWQELSCLPLKRFFNTSGNLYRELGMKNRFAEGISDEEAFELLSQNGMLIKRPIIVTEDGCLTGFREDAWSELLKLK